MRSDELLFLIANLEKNTTMVVMLSLDICGGCNCVNLTKLDKILLNFSVSLQVHLWILKFLLKRLLVSGADRVEVRGRISHSSCLSPILFNLHTAKLYDLQEDKTDIFQYADDF